MKLPRLPHLGLALAAVVLGSPVASALTIHSFSVSTQAGDGIDQNDFVSYSSSNNDFVAGLTQNALDGGSTGRTDINLIGEGDQATLSLDFTHGRGGLGGALAMTYSDMAFTVDAAATFELSGLYSVIDRGSSIGQTHIFASLREIGSGSSLLFRSQQIGDTGPNQTFIVGGAEGNIFHAFDGSLTGTLAAGSIYSLQVFAFTLASPDNDSGADASGNFTFKIGGGSPVASVPDTVRSLGLVSLGLACLAAFRRKLA